jgi:hypothetical protein
MITTAPFWPLERMDRQKKKVSFSRRILSYSIRIMESILNLTKSEIKTLSDILNGHSGLNYDKCRIGEIEDDICRLCMEERVYLCECPATASARLMNFEERFLTFSMSLTII